MATKKTARTTTIPKFKSEAEEAAWWESHPDFIVEQFEKAAKEGRLLRGIPKSKSVTIRIPMDEGSGGRPTHRGPQGSAVPDLHEDALASGPREGAAVRVVPS